MPLSGLVNELMYPDSETHIAYRLGFRRAARLVRAGADTETVDPAGRVALVPGAGTRAAHSKNCKCWTRRERSLEPREVRVAVEASGLNFWDVFRSLGLIDEGVLGARRGDMSLKSVSDVTSVSVGDRVVALAFGTFGSDAVMREEMVCACAAGCPDFAACHYTGPCSFVPHCRTIWRN